MPETLALFEFGQVKSVPLRSFAQVFMTGGEWSSEALTLSLAYRQVPWFRRACDLRANAVGSMPRGLFLGDQDRSEDPRYASFLRQHRRIYHLAEKSLFHYGCAYFLPESNRWGLNTRLRHIPSPLVRPVVDLQAGLTGFDVLDSKGMRFVAPKDIIYIWLPNHDSETEPAPGPGLTALESAGLLYYLGRFATMYFKAGAVPVTAALMPAGTPDTERDRVENFLNRMATGVRNAFKYIGLRAGTEFQQLGANVKDTRADQITAEKRDDVAVAAGVPPTVIDGKAANYATANSEWFGFYTTTVLPQCELIDETFNEQFFARHDVEVRSQPEKLEIMQAVQLEQAAAVNQLVGDEPILTLEEGRALLGYGPRASSLIDAQPGTEPEASESDDLAQMKTWRRAALAAVGQGVGAPFDAELRECHSRGEVRALFERRWPRNGGEKTAAEVLAMLERATLAAERLAV